MKDFRIIVLFTFLLSASLLQAQQLPVYTNYIFQPMLYNPATVGLDGDVVLTMNFQKAYNRAAGSPVTGWAGFDMPIMNENIGIGANFSVDNLGAHNNISGNVYYAYHIPFSEAYEHKLSIGLSAGFFHQRFNFIELNAADANDPALNVNNNGATAFDMNVGLNYRFKGLNVGFSVPQVLDSKLTFREGGNIDDTRGSSHLRRHYFVTAGYEIAMGKEKNFFLTPSASMRKIKGLPVQFDGNLLFDWDHMIWAGVSFKTANGFKKAASISPVIGFNIKDRLDINYAFSTDLDETENTDFGQGHEVMLKVRFGKRFKQIESRLDTLEDAVKRNAGAIAENGQRIDSLADELDSLRGDVNINTQNIAQNTGDIKETNENVQNIFNTVEELVEASKKSNVMYKKVGSVFFKNDRHELTDVAKAKLDAFKDALSTPEGEFFIYVAGNASEEASEQYNMLLSNRRAAEVKKYLESIGVGGHIFILAYGESAPMVDPQRTEEQRAQNRRVDIFISGK
ncbi:MAG: PorP/SprF family type IX secretion system membrane protein [Chitinophagales bacterium]